MARSLGAILADPDAGTTPRALALRGAGRVLCRDRESHAARALSSAIDRCVDGPADATVVAAAQEEDGYLYTARTIGDPNYGYPGKEARWSHLASGHELYNVGHMYEAAVAHYLVTDGKDRRLYNAAKHLRHGVFTQPIDYQLAKLWIGLHFLHKRDNMIFRYGIQCQFGFIYSVGYEGS